ncbi:MAG: hypothetical protein EXR71_11960 [Myxococcales bacterium]|nr:hypothetical protein [Myxococcales bacterium]
MLGLALALSACAPHAGVPSASGPALTYEVRTVEPFAQRLPRASADLVIHYGGENHGSLETCGCPNRPRGSLARFVGYATAAHRAAPSPTVRVNTGYWLTDAVDYAGHVRRDAEVMDVWAMRGMAAAGFDALNVTAHDVAGLVRVPPDPSLTLVSANVTGPGIVRYVIVERGGRTIGITGITGPAASMADTSAYPIAPAESATGVLAELVGRVDVVVLMGWQANGALRFLQKAVPGIDVILDSGLYADALPPVFQQGAAWTFSEYQMVRAGELRLRLDGGRVLGGVDRHIDLDAAVPDDPVIAKIAREARLDLDRVQTELYGGG